MKPRERIREETKVVFCAGKCKDVEPVRTIGFVVE